MILGMAVELSSVFRHYCYDTATKHSCNIVDIVVRGTEQRPIIEIYLDSREGVTLEHCTDISRELQEYADASDAISGNYRLDVSSPGVDRPLRYLWQYPKHIQRTLSIIDTNQFVYEGVLLGVDEEQSEIHLKLSSVKKVKSSEAHTVKTIAFGDIVTAKVLLKIG